MLRNHGSGCTVTTRDAESEREKERESLHSLNERKKEREREIEVEEEENEVERERERRGDRQATLVMRNVTFILLATANNKIVENAKTGWDVFGEFAVGACSRSLWLDVTVRSLFNYSFTYCILENETEKKKRK